MEWYCVHMIRAFVMLSSLHYVVDHVLDRVVCGPIRARHVLGPCDSAYS